MDADIERIPAISSACCVLHNISMSFHEELDMLNAEEKVDLPQVDDSQAQEVPHSNQNDIFKRNELAEISS